MKKTFCVPTIVYLFLALNVNAQISGVKKPDIKSIPNVDVYDLNGRHVNLQQIAKNKVLIIDNWFIPCPPCFIEMKMLHRLYKEYAANKDFCFITISRTDSSVVRKFIAKDSSMKKYISSYQFFSKLDDFKLPVYFLQGCNAKVVMEGKMMHDIQPDYPAKCADEVFHFPAYPTVMIFDKKGNVIFKKTGYDGNEEAVIAEIKNIIDPALAAK